MSDKFLVISGYTINSKYADEILDLESGLKEFKHEYKFYPYECQGDWVKNTMYKSRLIWNAINETDKDILWIDADAIVNGKLRLFNKLHQSYDLAFRYHLNPAIAGRNPQKDKTSKVLGGNVELLTGTLWFKNNDISKKLIYNWMISCNGSEIEWDQRILQRIYESNVFLTSMHRYNLGTEYVKIKKREQDIVDVGGIIAHKQLSRSERAKMLGGNRSTDSLFQQCRILNKDGVNKSLELFRKGNSIPEIQQILKLPDNPTIVEELGIVRNASRINVSDDRIANIDTYAKYAETFESMRNYFKNKSILVVGNSGILTDHDNSRFIDSFDCVIRMNFGVPQKNSGRKTHVWVYQHPQDNPEAIQSIIDTYTSFDPEKIIRFPFSPNTARFVKFDNMYFGRASQDHVRHFSSGTYVDERGNINARSSSTGAKVFDLLCKQFKYKVSAIGFDAFSSGTWYHKPTDYDGLGRAPCHDPNVERTYFAMLEREKEVMFYNEFGKCRPTFI